MDTPSWVIRRQIEGLNFNTILQAIETLESDLFGWERNSRNRYPWKASDELCGIHHQKQTQTQGVN
jgi:hypothetical protein